MLCLVCNAPLPSGNEKYCSQKCYLPTISENTHNKKYVLVNGEKMSQTDAVKALNTSPYGLTRMVMDETNTSVQPFPDRETFINEGLVVIYKNTPNAPTKEEILEAKANRIPMKELAKQRGMSHNTLSNLYLFYGIDTSFNQVDPSVTQRLDTELQKLFDQYGSAEQIAKALGVSPSLVLLKAHKYGVTVVQGRKKHTKAKG